ncbi:MAG: peptidoglycan editing factor PgeF [Alphaproteobacteria bacterium]|nr:peptidoglycan editing factor PgeF [Alphaproteobacteria bacterium]
MIKALQAENLKSLSGIRHGFFTRSGIPDGDVYTLPDEETADENMRNAVEVNRWRVAGSLGVSPECLLNCRQIHSPDVMSVTEPWTLSERSQADAMVTKQRGLALAILTADCVPILLAEEGAGVIGAVHAGWRGAIGGIIDSTLQAMEELGAVRKHIAAAIGPCIWQNSYEVGPEFPAPFLAEDPANEKLFRPAFRSGHYLFDLPGYVTNKLRALGVYDVEPSPGDTCADEARFLSYRRSCLSGEKDAGRLISAIALVN